MNYSVIISEHAKRNLRSYYLHAAKDAPFAAATWFNRFEKALTTLSSNPQRCSLAPENGAHQMEIRQLLFGRGRSAFRALYTIVADEVRVLHIRRASMDTAAPHELFE